MLIIVTRINNEDEEEIFHSYKGVKDGKRLDTGREKMNEKAFIQNTVKRLSFDKGTCVCFVTSSLETRHYFKVYTFFIRTS